MALTPEDLETLGLFIDKKLDEHTESQAQMTEEHAKGDAAKDYTRLAGVPQVDPEAGPDYYVHLANGDVIESKDAGATHMEVDGETVAVIGRYQKESKPETDNTTEAAK
jgi:hypothetical protein